MTILNKKIKSAMSVAMVGTIATTSTGVIAFANTAEDLKVNLSNFNVKLDGPGRILVEFSTDKDLDLKLFSKDNLVIKAESTTGEFKAKTKSKTWDGYLNDSEGNKYGAGTALPAGTYTTVFTGIGEVSSLENVKVTLSATKGGETSTLTYENGGVQAPEEKDFQIKKFEVGTNAPDQALVTFEINQTMDLSLNSKDNIKIEAINPSTGKAISTKGKMWSGYLNDEGGNKYGMGSTLKPGVYKTVFSAEQLEYINPQDVVIKLTATKNGVNYIEKNGEINIKEITPVEITNVSLEKMGEKDLVFGFDIDQTINLKLNTQDNIIIKAIDKNTGDTLSVKNKTWSNYLNDVSGVQFGLGEIVKSGRYTTKFTEEQLRGRKLDEVSIEVTVVQDNISSTVATSEYNRVKPVVVDELKVANHGEGLLIGFDIDQELLLKLNSKDNLIIEAINKTTGDVLTKKDKTWTDYLNDVDGNQFGLNELVVAGTYTNVFNKKQLKDTNLEDVAFRITAVQEGIKTTVLTEDVAQKPGVKVEDLETKVDEENNLIVDFNIDSDVNLGLGSKENITINLVDKTTGKVVSSKGKFEKAYLVDEEGNTYGFGDTLKAGRYSVRFSADELDGVNVENLQVIVTATKDGVDNTESTEKVEEGGILPTPEVDNVFAGNNRYETSVDVSVNGWESSDKVVLVSGNAVADGIAAAPLAGAMDAPILLTKSNSVPESVVNELKRLGTKEVTIIGGEAVISKDVEKQLTDMGMTINRISGATRYETSLNIAKQLGKSRSIKDAFVVGGNGEADGLSIGAVAGRKGIEAPIILVDKNKVNDDTKAWLKANVNEIDIIGGETVVSANVANILEETVGKDKVERVSGARRQETNAKIIDKYYEDFESVIVAKADDTGMVDGLTSSALAAKYDAPLVMVLNNLSKEQEEALAKDGDAQVYVVGHGIVKTVVDKITELLTRK